MTRTALDHGLHQACGRAFLNHLENVKPCTGAHDLGHLTDLQGLGRLDKQKWVTVGTAQAQLPSVVAVSRRGLFHQAVKVFTGTDAVQQALGLHKDGCGLLGGGFLGHGHQDLGQVDVEGQRVGVGRLLGLHGALHIHVGHLDGGLHITLMQAVQRQLVTQPTAEGGNTHAVFGQALVQAGNVHLILGGHGLLGTVNGRGINTDAGLTGQLQLGAVADHALQHQTAQLGSRGRCLALLRDLLRDTLDFTLQLLVRDGLGIHQRHDVIQRLAGLRV